MVLLFVSIPKVKHANKWELMILKCTDRKRRSLKMYSNILSGRNLCGLLPSNYPKREEILTWWGSRVAIYLLQPMLEAAQGFGNYQLFPVDFLSRCHGFVEVNSCQMWSPDWEHLFYNSNTVRDAWHHQTGTSVIPCHKRMETSRQLVQQTGLTWLLEVVFVKSGAC